jgi:hypothetical protein
VILLYARQADLDRRVKMGAEERYEHTTFPSRKTTFPLFAEEVGDGWLQLLNLVMHCGTVKGVGKGERLAEVLNAIVTVNLAGEAGLPACFDIGTDEFEVYYQRSFSVSSPEGVNQLDSAIDRLQGEHDTATGTMVFLGPTDLDTLDDAPCIISVTFNIVDERLYGTCVVRSDDIYNAWPLNALSLIRLQKEVSQRIGVPADSATFVSHSAHIYEGDWGKARAKLDRWFERPLPLKADPAGLFFFGVESGRARVLFVGPDVDTVLWEGESADPEDLVRHIVDTMPWLSAQHVRYLGEEAAKLSRALSEGIPYEQG